MKILAIGDPHGNLGKLRKINYKNIDLILLTGDLGKVNLARKFVFRNIERRRKGLKEIDETPNQEKQIHMEIYYSSMEVLEFLSKKATVFTIFGNVEMKDVEIRKKEKRIGLKLPKFVNGVKMIGNYGVRIINNNVRNFKGVRIGGVEYFVDDNWVIDFIVRSQDDYLDRLKYAKKSTEKAKKVLRWFDKLEVLVCHQPPYSCLDKVTWKNAPKRWIGKHAGSKVILEYIKRKQPKYVFCGHIHEGEGHKRIGKSRVYNLGVCGYKIIEF